MCAQFHPTEDLVVSCSLDQTVRVWDISGLRKKVGFPAAAEETPQPKNPVQTDLFGNTDAIVKFVLEGHDRGVNWAAFHPTLPLIVSAADDRQVKLWRMNDTKAWEVDTCRGHFNNVSCAIFHPRQELLLSNGEDKSLRVWDMSKRTAVQTFRREHDRFWILTAHPEQNLFAAGHDSGLIVFKLERERPAYTVHGNICYYIKDKYLRSYEFTTNRDVPVVSIRRGNGQYSQPRSISYNPAEHSILITKKSDGGNYELYALPKDATTESREGADPKRGMGSSAVFVARNRFAVFDKTNKVMIKNLKNELTKQFSPPNNADEIFYAGTGNILFKSEEQIILFDVQQQKVLAELAVPPIRYVIWSSDMSMVALLAKHAIIICNKKLEQLCTIHETIRVKSGAWDDQGIFVYSTLNHLKYALPSGDNGIIRTLDQPLYVVSIIGNTVYTLDRDCKPREITIDPTEYKFKLALIERKYDQVLNIIRNSNLVGQAIIAYLQKKGYPEIALHFVRDNQTRFNLALECGNLNVAQETAQAIDKEPIWDKLATEALRLGNHQVAETALKRIKSFEKLSFLYLIIGDVEKLKKMLKIAEMRNDPLSRFHNALYLGDVEEQLKILKDVGQYGLAYALAKTMGYEEEAQLILEANEKDPEEAPQFPKGGLLYPLTPILRHSGFNWPLLNVARDVFGSAFPAPVSKPSATKKEEAPLAAALLQDHDLGEVGGEWAGDDLEIGEEGPSASGDVGGDWELEDEDLKLDLEKATDIIGSGSAESYFVPPTQGTSVAELWQRNSKLPSDHVLAGAFESAMRILHQELGIVNFEPLKNHFMILYTSSRTSLPAIPSVPSLLMPIQVKQESSSQTSPVVPITVSNLVQQLQAAYQITTAGKFTEAVIAFKNILYWSIFVVTVSKAEMNELQQLVDICQDYILGLKMETVRKDLPKDSPNSATRVAELAAYFTHCNMQPIHLMLSLRSAMNIHYKLKNFRTAASFARRLLELGPKEEIATQARKLQAICDKTPVDEVKLEYNEHNPFEICGQSYTPIYRGAPAIKCSFCNTSFLPKFKGILCPTCEIGEVGLPSNGRNSVNLRK